MKSKRIITLLGFVCVLVLALCSASTAIAEEEGNFKNHDGTWILPSQNGQPSAYLICASTGNSSSRSYTCTGSVFMPDGIVPMFWDGFFTGPRTYRERGIGYIYSEPYDLILVQIDSGRIRDYNTSENNSIFNIYMDFDGDGLPSDYELVIPGSPQSGTIYRMGSVFPDIPFPDYPSEP